MSGLPDCDARCPHMKGPRHLHQSYSEGECHGPEAKRRNVVKLIDKWVDDIKEGCGLNSKRSDPCSGCYPAFTCLAPFPYKRPFCQKKRQEPLITNIPIFERRLVSDKKAVSDQDDRVEIVLVDTAYHDPPVWERPRIRSQRLIGGNFKTLTSCFKRNGLVLDDCPRTPSCQLIRSMAEWIEVDKKANIPKPKFECCCCPGVTSTVPDFECVTCKLENEGKIISNRQSLAHSSNRRSFRRPSCEERVHQMDNPHTYYQGEGHWGDCCGKQVRLSGELWPDAIRHKQL